MVSLRDTSRNRRKPPKTPVAVYVPVPEPAPPPRDVTRNRRKGKAERASEGLTVVTQRGLTRAAGGSKAVSGNTTSKGGGSSVCDGFESVGSTLARVCCACCVNDAMFGRDDQCLSGNSSMTMLRRTYSELAAIRFHPWRGGGLEAFALRISCGGGKTTPDKAHAYKGMHAFRWAHVAYGQGAHCNNDFVFASLQNNWRDCFRRFEFHCRKYDERFSRARVCRLNA
eukprot:1119210-Prorocentrum_minimum.AAC.9